MLVNSKNLILIANYVSSSINATERLLLESNNIHSDILYTRKKNGEYGYYGSNNVYEMYKLLKYFKIHSLVDLGAGTGAFLLKLKIFDDLLSGRKCIRKYIGIEIESDLCKFSQTLQTACGYYIENIEIVQGNFFKIKSEFHKCDAFYFWEPVWTNPEKFVKNLEKISIPGQYIFYKRSGNIINYLHDSSKFQMIKSKSDIPLNLILSAEKASIYIFKRI